MIRVLSLALILLVNSSTLARGADRVVAIGDVHGNIDGLIEILRETQLIDEANSWIGGDTRVVQTGDLLDRGAEVRRVLDLMIRLQGEARQAGGDITVLLGNHEAMNLVGILRDVNPEVYASFVDSHSHRRQRRAFRAYKDFWKRRARQHQKPAPDFSSIKKQWLDQHPPGFLEYIDAMSAIGRYGSWLRQCPIAVKLDGTAFLHGGPGPALAGMDVATINRTAASELAAFDLVRSWAVNQDLVLEPVSMYELAQATESNSQNHDLTPELQTAIDMVQQWQQWLIIAADGPLWFRGAATWKADRKPILKKLMRGLEAERIVIGHTPQRTGRINSRLDHLVFVIDTGMLSSVYRGGRPSALEIRRDTIEAVYPGERTLLWQREPKLPRASGQ